MISRGQFKTAIDDTVDGVAGRQVDVLDLDDLSFRAWLLRVLFDRGAISSQAVTLGEPVHLKTAGEPRQCYHLADSAEPAEGYEMCELCGLYALDE